MTPLQSKGELIPTVAKQVNTLWERLARGLGLSLPEIEIIKEEDKYDQQRCCKVLDTWCQRDGAKATVKRLMKTLTDVGLAIVNNDVIKCLGLNG